MVTEYTYQIARVHFELVREWNQKRRNYLAERVISSLIFGIGFGFGIVFLLKIIVLLWFEIDLSHLNSLMASLALNVLLFIYMFISERSPKPSIHDAKFIVDARRYQTRNI
ncbi:hypothetical protein FPV63_12430 [Vibrio cholerae]|nr:hypothetical protein FPV63_12430 [Vibrio cholerae]